MKKVLFQILLCTIAIGLQSCMPAFGGKAKGRSTPRKVFEPRGKFNKAHQKSTTEVYRKHAAYESSELDSRSDYSNDETSSFGGKAKGRSTPREVYESRGKFNKAYQKSTTEVNKKHATHETSELDSDSDYSDDEISGEQSENATGLMDREILFEWYDYGYSIKELLNLMDYGAKRCGCTPMNESVLKATKRINWALNSVSFKLRYGSDYAVKKYESRERRIRGI